MTKKSLSLMMEWLRPAGIGLAIFFAYYLGRDAISRFHIMGPFAVMLMSGTVAFESLKLCKATKRKQLTIINHLAIMPRLWEGRQRIHKVFN